MAERKSPVHRSSRGEYNAPVGLHCYLLLSFFCFTAPIVVALSGTVRHQKTGRAISNWSPDLFVLLSLSL